MEKRDEQSAFQPAARAGGLFGSHQRAQEPPLQRSTWPFQVKAVKPPKRSFVEREGPDFKS